MRLPLLALVLLVGCGWQPIAPAPRDGLAAVQAEAYRALAHSLSGFMNASADDIELDLQLAGVLEEVLLHARAADSENWRKARTALELELGSAKVPQQTVVELWLDPDAPWRDRWAQGEQLSGVSALDDIIAADDIRVVKAGVIVQGYYNLVVPREVNGFALANQIAKVPGIGSPIAGWDLYAWGNYFQFGSGVAIRPEPQLLGGWSLRVSIGWGDCPSGCINGRLFEFEVSPGGQTRLVRESGDPLP